MELSLGISIFMLLVIIVSFTFMLKELKECQKIIKKMQRRSRKYMREVVSND